MEFVDFLNESFVADDTRDVAEIWWKPIGERRQGDNTASSMDAVHDETAGVDPDFLKGGSTLELQLQPSCKLKTKKKKKRSSPAENSCPLPSCVSIYN